MASLARHSRMALLLLLGMGFPVLSPVPASAQLDANPLSYHLLARERLSTKNYTVVTPGPGCNVGVVNHGGLLTTDSSSFSMAAGTQIVADDCSGAGGNIGECFCNTGGSNFSETCSSWTPPLLGDASDAAFIAACDLLPGDAFPTPCSAGTQTVVIEKNADCAPLSLDSNPGNNQCDLVAGDYDVIDLEKAGTLQLNGTYTVNAYESGKNTTLIVLGSTTLNVCSDAGLSFADKGSINASCGEFRVNYAGTGVVNMGNKQGTITMDLCAPFAEKLRLRRGNTLEGHFFAQAISSDHSNIGRCCGAAVNACLCFGALDGSGCVSPGETVSLTDVAGITDVSICGSAASCTSTGVDEIDCVVPSVPAGSSCEIEVTGTGGTSLVPASLNICP